MGSTLDPKCSACGAGISREQRYCLSCGTRNGSKPFDSAEQAFVRPDGGGAAFTLAGFGTRSLMAMALSLLLCGTIVGSAFSPPPVDSLAAGNTLTMAQAFPSGVTGGGRAGAPLFNNGATNGHGIQGNSFPQNLNNSTYSDSTFSGNSGSSSGSGSSGTPAAPVVPPNVGHVIVVMLPTGTDKTKATPEALGEITASTASAAGASAASAPTLASRGVLYKGFRQVGDNAAANGFALLAGQRPNADFKSGCLKLSKLDDSVAKVDKNGVLATNTPGCLIDKDLKLGNLAEQVRSAAGDGAFAVYHDVAPATPSAHLCERIAVGANVTSKHRDVTSLPANPANWFEALREDGTACWNAKAKSGINRRLFGATASGLKSDLNGSAAPALSIVLPKSNATAGTAALNSTVSKVFTTVRHSKVWHDSMLVFVWDSQALGTGSSSDANPASGAVVVSPFATAGTSVPAKSAFNTFDLVASIQEQLGLAAAGDDILGNATLSTRDLVTDTKKFKTLEPKPLGK